MYVRSHDYKLYCDTQTLTQIVNIDLSLRRLCEFAAEDQIKTYLIQRYDFKKPYGEFTDTDVYDNSATYVGNSRVYLDGVTWSAASPYSVSTLVLYTDGNVYIKNSNTSGYAAQVPTDTSYWTKLGVQYDLYYVQLPQTQWDFITTYQIGDKVFYRDKVFTATIQSKNIPPDSQYGVNYWGSGTPFSVPTGTLPTDTSYWTYGDNRNNYLLQLYICIVIYNMFMKIAPKNIPVPREKSYYDAIGWLKDAASGVVSADLPLLTPEAGSSIRWGSVQQSNNIY